MKTSYELKDLSSIKGATVAILQAKWHSEHTDKMVSACQEILTRAEAKGIDVIKVPGSYELSLTAKLLAKQKKYDAIIVFGVILKGETDHYKVILDTCISGLERVMYDFEIPIIMELLPVNDIKQVIERSEGKNNKGIEAALAAIEIINLKSSLVL